jgi:hypothetical protein
MLAPYNDADGEFDPARVQQVLAETTSGLDIRCALLGAGEWLRSNDLSRQFAPSSAATTALEVEPDLARFRLDFTP